MGKKYLETKKDSLESSVLGVWQNAIEEGDAREAAARMDGRTRGYKSHRAKLEAARTRREEKKKLNVGLDEAKGYLELEFKDKQAAENAYSQINNKILPGGNPPYEDFNQEGNTLQFDTRDKNQTKNLMKELQSGGLKGFKVAVQEEVELDEAFIAEIKEEISELDALIKELDEGILGNIAKAAGKTVAKGAKAAYGKVKKKVGGSRVGRAYGKAKAGVKKAKSIGGKIKTAVKTGKAYGDEYDPMLEKLEIIESKLNDYCKILEEVEVEQIAEASGDKEAYKKFFNAALKKFKVGSPAELKGDDKKKFFDYIDKNWEGDNEKAEAAMSQVREFKIQSMKDALAKVWGMEEGHNPFKKKEDNDKVLKKGEKTLTGKKAAEIDLNPEIKDR
jgi:hypothetical protein